MRKWNKGYNRVRRQLRAQVEHLEQMWDNRASVDDICEVYMQVRENASPLPTNDSARVYLERASDIMDAAAWKAYEDQVDADYREHLM